jgi:anaerobic selenocysteine-containing dehydrogenase
LASTGTVLWARVLDRLAGPRPPKIVVMDPRRSPTADHATVHLRPRIGTNLAVINGLLAHIFKHDYVNRRFLDDHVIGEAELRETVAKYTPEYVEEISGIPVATFLEAAEIIGNADRLLITALQGVYQSHQCASVAYRLEEVFPNVRTGRRRARAVSITSFSSAA